MHVPGEPHPSRHINGPGGRARGSGLLSVAGGAEAATTRRRGLLARHSGHVVDVQRAVKVSSARAFPHSVARILWARPPLTLALSARRSISAMQSLHVTLLRDVVESPQPASYPQSEIAPGCLRAWTVSFPL
jgi:hypothetical protein